MEDKIFNALSDNNRLKILMIINDNKEMCGCDILEKLSITQPTLTYHMKILQEVGLVKCLKKGTWCVYKIDREKFDIILNFINLFIKENN
jgi:ArsR family transcriptional regulator, arsenate/arsenite/antimonite-responsive transcriptional repressor